MLHYSYISMIKGTFVMFLLQGLYTFNSLVWSILVSVVSGAGQSFRVCPTNRTVSDSQYG